MLVCKDGFPVLDVTGVTFHYGVWLVFGTASAQDALCSDTLLSATLVGSFAVSLFWGLPFLSPLRSPQTQTLCMASLFSVILESWMGTLHCLWIKHPPFSPENPAGQARPFDRGVSVLILFPEPPSEAMLERWFSHTGLSLEEQIHLLCEGPGPLHTQLSA